MRCLAHWLRGIVVLAVCASAGTATPETLECPRANDSINALMARADCFARLGLIAQESASLASALNLADDTTPVAIRVAILHRLGNAARMRGDEIVAYRYLHHAIALAAHAEQPLAAPVFNDLGKLLLDDGAALAALAAYADGLRTADRAPALRATLLLNLETTATRAGLQHRPELWLGPAGDEIAKLASTRTRASFLLSLGSARQALGPSGFDAAAAAYLEALALLDNGAPSREQAYAYGYLGSLREQQGATASAMQQTRKALLIAQTIGAQDNIYLWEWQLGRLLRTTDPRAAVAMYEIALESLEGVRAEFWASSSAAFEERIRPLFNEYVDLLIGPRGSTPSAESLNRARLALELGHRAELEDYYRSDCTDANEASPTLAQLAPNVAVLYPIVLPDRVELLLGTASGLTRRTDIVSGSQVRDTARLLRLQLELQQAPAAYLKSARALYEWLIRPVRPVLTAAGIDTLVIVPDPTLRGMPFAALHDGGKYMVESYRLVMTPGLTLMSRRVPTRRSRRVLAAGISESRFGFRQLPFVPSELKDIDALFPTRVELNSGFTARTLETGVRGEDYNIVHIATHGRFAGDYRQSFLVAYDKVVSMPRFEAMLGGRRFSGSQIDLLVLSACQTAAGDERAALGLAGVAVQSGARDAIASLWQLDDEATAQLMATFYGELKDPATAPATALQRAQLAMLADERFGHPAYWAPFVLVGDWR